MTTIEPLDDPAPEAQPLLDIDGDDTKPSGMPDPEPTPEPEPAKDTRQVNEEEYNLMVEKAGVVDLIQANPQLSQYVSDTLRNGIANPPSADPADPSEDFGDLENHPAFKQIMERVTAAENGAKQAAAAAQVMTFGQDHPDLSKYQTEIGKLVQDHGMDLPTAYKYAKALAGDNGTVAAPRPTSEGKGPGSSPVQDGESDILAAARAKINDPKAKVRIEDAMDIAWEAATRQHNTEE